MIVMGIDQSFKCTGIVVMNHGIMIHHCIIETKKEDFDNVYQRLNHICFEIMQLVIEYKPEKVVIEGIAFAAKGRVIDLAGLFHCIVMIINQLAIPVSVVPPTTLKKAATGNGKAGKWLMYDTLPITTQDEFKLFYKSSSRKAKNANGSLFDITDAWWLAKMGDI